MKEGRVADGGAWLRFVEVVSLTVGAGLLLAGIIFFFAYNWQEMHRLAKIGIAVGMILAVFGAVMTVRMQKLTRDIMVSAMSVLVGVFWAIYGQVYQTEADSYVFFLTWAACIAVWVFVTDFYPLWAFFWLLTTVGVSLFFGWTLLTDAISNLMMLYGAVWIAFFLLSPRVLPGRSEAPVWFVDLLFTYVFGIATIVMVVGVFRAFETNALVALAVAGVTAWQAWQRRDIWLYSMLYIGALSLLEAFMIQAMDFRGAILNILILMAAIGASAYAIKEQSNKWKKETTGKEG